MNSIKHIILLALLAFSWISYGQYGFHYDNSIVVKEGTDTLTNAWGGGLNYTQVCDFDYDFDGDLDIFLFDRSSNNVRVYTQEGTGANKHYELAYGARRNFPDDLLYRATLVDYDNDGRKDLWAYNLSGFKVYRNVGDITNGLQWELVTNLLYSEYPLGPSTLFVSGSDIPAIVDVDHDGDMDVLTFHQGGSNVEYHQNQSMELYGIPDSLVYELKNQCWGLFTEDFNTNVITLNETAYPCQNGDITNPEIGVYSDRPETARERGYAKHAGSTLMAIDIDNSGVYDLVLGDVTFATMTLLMNGGTAPNTNSPMVSQDNNFPSNTTPVNIELFPAAFYVDVDFDGVKDLVVGANVRNISENETSIRFYKNTGTNELPNFVFSANDLFQNEMIDHGTGAIPVIVDYNEDGLDDLMVANFYRFIFPSDKESTIAYYQNTGTANDPEYTFVDYNMFDLDQESFGLRSVPTFGDIDGDGDDDMFIGIEDGTLVYYQNNSVGAGSVFGAPQLNYPDNNAVPISGLSYAFPQLFDLDNDGLLDLVIGSRTGEIIYYRNIGTANAPSFELTNSQLGNVDLSGANPNAFTAPHFMRTNGDTHLFAGEYEGKLYFFDDIDGNLNPGDSFNMVTDHFLDINVQAYSSFTTGDIDNDGNLSLFVGQDLGGLYHFKADPNSDASIQSLEETGQVALYPNPGDDQVMITSDLHAMQSVKFIDMNGKVVLEVDAHSMNLPVNISVLDKGVYSVMVSFEGTSSTVKKFIKL